VGEAGGQAPDTYSVPEAAKILKLTDGRVRQMLRAGELEGIPPEESGERGWRIPMHAVHDRDRPPRIERPERPPEATERLAELEADVRDLNYRLGLSEGRLELTQRAESTLREALQREQERADRERDRAEQLRAELDEERARGFWRRLFGG
jgi:excisionase family DNA binding protein